ncbi:MAG: hypothetical protein KME40_22365 [Komarekiella atlantica HA4396-MV6]|nr:hypothetical protein [Komarekiella atlantica HA4396-MV6]
MTLVRLGVVDKTTAAKTVSRSWGASALESQHVAEVPSVVVTGVGSPTCTPAGKQATKQRLPLGEATGVETPFSTRHYVNA